MLIEDPTENGTISFEKDNKEKPKHLPKCRAAWSYRQVAAVWINTSGPDPMRECVLELAFVPLDYRFGIRKRPFPITAKLRPTCVVKTHKNDREMHFTTFLKGFEKWYDQLELDARRGAVEPARLMLLGYNMPNVIPFLTKLFGWHTYHSFFSTKYFDILGGVHLINNKEIWNSRVAPFIGVKFSDIRYKTKSNRVYTTGSPIEKAADCAAIWKKLCSTDFFSAGIASYGRYRPIRNMKNKL